MTTETQSPVAIELEDEKPISNYAAILEHSHQYQTTMAVEEPENNQIGLSTAFSDTSSDCFDELVTYHTPRRMHD